jgi:hypothetical protein
LHTALSLLVYPLLAFTLVVYLTLFFHLNDSVLCFLVLSLGAHTPDASAPDLVVCEPGLPLPPSGSKKASEVDQRNTEQNTRPTCTGLISNDAALRERTKIVFISSSNEYRIRL